MLIRLPLYPIPCVLVGIRLPWLLSRGFLSPALPSFASPSDPAARRIWAGFARRRPARSARLPGVDKKARSKNRQKDETSDIETQQWVVFPTAAATINYHLKSHVLLLGHLRHLSQQVSQSLLCSMRNVVDHICAQLADTKLLTCHNRSECG